MEGREFYTVAINGQSGRNLFVECTRFDRSGGLCKRLKPDAIGRKSTFYFFASSRGGTLGEHGWVPTKTMST